MPFTIAELENIANQSIDFYFKNEIGSQSLQDRPTLKMFRSKQKTFPGGKDQIKGNVKGTYDTEFVGFSHDDTVSYGNPANVKQFAYDWYEIHAGISMTLTELKHDGITVEDSLNGEKTSQKSQRELVAITSIMQDKLEDMDEGSMQSMNAMLWRDGTQDSKVFPGIPAIIVNDPTSGVGAGIDRAANAWWRNRALVGANKITASASNQTLTKTLRSEVRQLRRYGGRPTMLACGSDFIEALELEVHEKGIYTQSGFVNNGKTDIGMSDISMRGAGTFYYEPILDDLGLTKFCYMMDPRHIFFDVMDGEDMKRHSPARPAEKYVLYRAITWTGGLICRKMNAHGVYEVA